MRADPQKQLNENREKGTLNVIRQTRKMIRGMSEQQRFKKALQHVNDALQYKQPRPDAYGPNLPRTFQIAYRWQTSKYWTWLLFIIGYIYMYSIILNDTTELTTKLVLDFVILGFYWFDSALYLYHKSFETLKISSKFQFRFYCKMVILIILTIDIIISAATEGKFDKILMSIQILRGLLPIFYDALTRKSFVALIASWKDILVFAIFYSSVILSVALLCTQVIDFPAGTKLDQNYNNYPSFLKSIYITWTLSSYDSYPDNQLPAIRWNIFTYAIFISFIFLNVFFFSTIPSTIILNSFRQTRSKTILIDEIRQQHSLILAFVSLGEENYNIDTNTLIKFLLYMYRHKVRYVNCITDICLQLDDNNNGSIQISQFMQLCKILTKNSHLLPPEFDDWKAWIQFRQLVIQHTQLQYFVKTWAYRFFVNLVILLTFINCIALIASGNYILQIFDYIFMGIFVLDLILRNIGLGPQTFFKDKWNHLDSFIIISALILQCIPVEMIPRSSAIMMKMLRIFRIATLIKLIRGKSSKVQNFNPNSIYYKARRMWSQMTIIIPIFIKFFPLFLISYYIFGVIGMELFRDAVPNDSSMKYSMYAQFSNFQSFMGTQFILIQVLTEAGWSIVCWNYAERTGTYFPVALYFMFLHLMVVLVISALLKGLIWEVYFTVHDQHQEQLSRELAISQKQLQIQIKKQQFTQIRKTIQQSGFITPNSIIKREFLQNKLDIQIFKRLKQLYVKQSHLKPNNQSHLKPKKRSQVIGQIVLDKKELLIQNYEQAQGNSQSQIAMNKLYDRIIKQNLEEGNLDVIEEEDFQEQMEDLMNKLVLHPKMKFSQTIVYPKVLLELLEHKFVKAYDKKPQKTFDINKMSFENKQGIEFHTYQLKVLLQIQRSQRDQKMQIIKNMTDTHLISQDEAKQLFSKKKLFQKNNHIDINWIIRKMFLQGTNEQMIKKFQIQYFSDVYGRSFKQINKVTIQPLLKYQAQLSYNLRNLLRYPQIPNNNFFQLLTKIQSSISNKLLKKGSLFKFIYQIQALADNWFTIEYNKSDQIRIHFIKTGVWIYNRKMKPQEFYFAEDLFKWDVKQRQDRITCQKILKLLYQTFQGLAFGLQDQNSFFLTNPVNTIYDAYSIFVDVTKAKRNVTRKLEITKVMLVVLSKQQQRNQQQLLQYQLSEIIGSKRQKRNIDFKFDQSERQTFNKLKNFSALDHQKIVQNEGLPFAYVLNLMRQVKDILRLHSASLVNQVEKILNEQFQKN